MGKILVSIKDNEYNIYIEKNFESIARRMKEAGVFGVKMCVVTDSVVNGLYADELERELNDVATDVRRFVFPAGEASKTLSVVSDMYEFFLANRLDRRSAVVALGGGVCGDMAGFAAATYMRGVRFVQVPTTLLSQVDSGVGGKTGVDFAERKNIIGAFYQPKLTYINVSTLDSLPGAQLASGIGEAIKHGLIADAGYFSFIRDSARKIKEREKDALMKLVERSCEIKAKIVSKDEKESDLRAILNFGHTVGHAIEALKNFKLAHGHCVAIGCLAALRLSCEKGGVSDREVDAAADLFRFFDLPVSFSGIDERDVYEAATYDKKAVDGAINMILLEKIGKARVYEKTPFEDIIYAISAVKEPEK
ncbi:MAG: 3-dehydroquinate synthase [Clostridiales bacterium]|jgi:3-dehydroquinate synthase|nr:3-dehydroquinate synthase [Clostridiales bacterium]